MLLRLAAIATFLLTVYVLNVWGARRDKAAGAPFEVTPPEGFAEVDRKAAALIAAGGDEAESQALGTGGALYLHFAAEGDEADGKYTEVLEVSEDVFPVRVGEEERKSYFGRGVVALGDHQLRVLESRIVDLGGRGAIFGKMEAEVDGKKVLVHRWIFPSDKGRAIMDAYCLASEEAKYRPMFDRAAASVRGVATRPERIPWYFVSAISAVAASVVYFGIGRMFQPPPPPAPRVPAKRDEEDDEADDEADDHAPSPPARKA